MIIHHELNISHLRVQIFSIKKYIYTRYINKKIIGAKMTGQQLFLSIVHGWIQVYIGVIGRTI